MKTSAFPSARPARGTSQLQELALKLLGPLTDVQLSKDALANIASVARGTPLTSSEDHALTTVLEEPLSLEEHQISADSSKSDRACAASNVLSPSGTGCWVSAKLRPPVDKSSLTITLTSAADLTALILDLPTDTKQHAAMVGLEYLPAPRPGMSPADIAAVVGAARSRAQESAAAVAAMLAMGRQPARWIPVGVIPVPRLAQAGPGHRVAFLAPRAIAVRISCKGFGPANAERLHALRHVTLMRSAEAALGTLAGAAQRPLPSPTRAPGAAPAAGGSATPPQGSKGDPAYLGRSALFTQPRDVLQSLEELVSASVGNDKGMVNSQQCSSRIAIDSGSAECREDEEDEILAERVRLLHALALSSGAVTPVLQLARLLLSTRDGQAALPPQTSRAVLRFLVTLALQHDHVGAACDGARPGAGDTGSALHPMDRTPEATFADVTSGLSLEDEGGRSVKSRSSPEVAATNFGLLKGRMEWEMHIDKDTMGEECTCFGVARRPVSGQPSRSYDSGNEMWLWRAYNGLLYARGSHTGQERARFHQGDSVRFLLDMDRRELHAWVNGAPQGVLFADLPGDQPLYPCVQLYSSHRAASLTRLVVLPGAAGPSLVVCTPGPNGSGAVNGLHSSTGAGAGAAAGAGSAQVDPLPARPGPSSAPEALAGAADAAAGLVHPPPGALGHTAYVCDLLRATPAAGSADSAAESAAQEPVHVRGVRSRHPYVAPLASHLSTGHSVQRLRDMCEVEHSFMHSVPLAPAIEAAYPSPHAASASGTSGKPGSAPPSSRRGRREHASEAGATGAARGAAEHGPPSFDRFEAIVGFADICHPLLEAASCLLDQVRCERPQDTNSHALLAQPAPQPQLNVLGRFDLGSESSRVHAPLYWPQGLPALAHAAGVPFDLVLAMAVVRDTPPVLLACSQYRSLDPHEPLPPFKPVMDTFLRTSMSGDDADASRALLNDVLSHLRLVWADARVRVAPWEAYGGACVRHMRPLPPSDEHEGKPGGASGFTTPYPGDVPFYPLLAVVSHTTSTGNTTPRDAAALLEGSLSPQAPLSAARAATLLLRLLRLFSWQALRTTPRVTPEPGPSDAPASAPFVPWCVQLEPRAFAALVALLRQLQASQRRQAAPSLSAAADASESDAPDQLVSALWLARANVARLAASRLNPRPFALPELMECVRQMVPTGPHARRGRPPPPAALAAREMLTVGLPLFFPSDSDLRTYLTDHIAAGSGGMAVVEVRLQWPVPLTPAASSAAGTAQAAPSHPARGAGGRRGSLSSTAPVAEPAAGGATNDGSGGQAPSGGGGADGRFERAVLLLQSHAGRAGWRHDTVGLFGATLHFVAELPLTGAPVDAQAGEGETDETPASRGTRVDLHDFLCWTLPSLLASAGLAGWAFPRGSAHPPVACTVVGSLPRSPSARPVNPLGDPPPEGAPPPCADDAGCVGSVRLYPGWLGAEAGAPRGAASVYDSVLAAAEAGLKAAQDAAPPGSQAAASRAREGGSPSPPSAPCGSVDVFGDPLGAPGGGLDDATGGGAGSLASLGLGLGSSPAPEALLQHMRAALMQHAGGGLSGGGVASAASSATVSTPGGPPPACGSAAAAGHSPLGSLDALQAAYIEATLEMLRTGGGGLPAIRGLTAPSSAGGAGSSNAGEGRFSLQSPGGALVVSDVEANDSDASDETSSSENEEEDEENYTDEDDEEEEEEDNLDELEDYTEEEDGDEDDDEDGDESGSEEEDADS